MTLNFQDDTITIFDDHSSQAQSRHYAIPIMRAKQLINSLDRETNIPLEDDHHTNLVEQQRQPQHHF